MSTRCVVVFSLVSFVAAAGEKPCIVYKAPPSTEEDDRPVATAITVGPQGSDYAFKVDFNKAPWGEECKTRCANATIFLDTDNNKQTGLKLPQQEGKDAPETGADLAVTIQGLRIYKDQSSLSTLKIKVKQYSEDATSAEQGTDLVEMDSHSDTERLNPVDKTVYLLVDANVGSLPSNPKIRVIYHPPDAKPIVGYAKGLNAPGASRVEIFKDGKLTNPVKKKKKDYETY